ncbi:hypothetical protein GIB67_000086 [Kingdonia uniflora]|uniref:H15 domain-containing protein n=1 Tax=Kingdonia uniflora TaxID=39325 RepID=A0A7J7M5U9_9MAGN|nr:hypothetical protein GIB67_000086 [Kingdonia uniflora]
MATEEVNKPQSSLPPYSEMIFAAISEEEEGSSSKSAISKHIELTYEGLLPEDHITLLSHHLNKMKDSGELVLTKNNDYMLPTAPTPKRGRGRPPKAKKDSSLPPKVAAVTLTPSRGRGRPPKAKELSDDVLVVPVAPVAEKETSVGSPKRGRGRPPKKPRTDEEAKMTVAESKVVMGSGRPRGRPPKVKPQLGTVGV